jgi:hypothetical protein
MLSWFDKTAASDYLFDMSTVAEIEAAIRKLPPRKARALAMRLQGWLAPRQRGLGEKAAAKKSLPPAPLQGLARAAALAPADLPTNAAAQHDHYLYGSPKRR